MPPEPCPLDGWTIRKANLCTLDEVIDTQSRLVLIDPSRHGERWMRDHVTAHFELGHVMGSGGRFTARQECDADALASVKRVKFIPWLDDEATEHMPAFSPSELDVR